MKAYLDKGNDINAKDLTGETLLHLTAVNGNYQV